MSEFDIQLFVALVVSLMIAYPIYYMTRNKYRRLGKSIKYLEYKIAIFIMTPILSIPVLLRPSLTPLDKIIGVILMIVGGCAYLYGASAARRAFRKLFGLPQENKDTGEVMKNDN